MSAASDRERIIVEGVITEQSRDVYTVRVDVDGAHHFALCKLAGALTHGPGKARVMTSDRVRVELSAADPRRGRILARL